MSDWAAHTYEETADRFSAYFERLVRETGLGRYELDVVHRWEQAMTASQDGRDDVQTLLTLLAVDEPMEGLHGGTAWEEVRLAVRNWAKEQSV